MNFAEGSFSGKVIAITGAASGMGAACARAFSDLGGTVVIIDIDEENASTVAGEIMGEDPIIGDISDSSFCIEAIEKITERYRRLDVLVNAAGTIHRADALGTTNDDWRRVMGVNIDGMFYLSRAAVDYMAKRGSGTIVNFGSIWGGVASAGSTAYCVSKGAVHQLTRAMALGPCSPRHPHQRRGSWREFAHPCCRADEPLRHLKPTCKPWPTQRSR